MLLFNTEEFFEVFARYNAAIWPAQADLARRAQGVQPERRLRIRGCRPRSMSSEVKLGFTRQVAQQLIVRSSTDLEHRLGTLG